MARPVVPPPTRTAGTNPGLIVGATVVMVVLTTFVIFAVTGHNLDQEVVGGGRTGKLAGPASVGACGQGEPADPGYSVDYVTNPDPPRPEGTTVVLTVRHEGKAVSGAKVCLIADMPDMEHPALNKAFDEASGGRYEARVQFGMGGSWRLAVTVAEPNKAVVSVPIRIQVAPLDP